MQSKKEFNEHIKITGVQPEGCNFRKGLFVPHKIKAIAVGVIPPFLDLQQIDGFLDIFFDEVQEIRKYLSEKEGIFTGISSGANILAAMKLSKEYNNNENIVTVAPDSGISYL